MHRFWGAWISIPGDRIMGTLDGVPTHHRSQGTSTRTHTALILKAIPTNRLLVFQEETSVPRGNPLSQVREFHRRDSNPRTLKVRGDSAKH